MAGEYGHEQQRSDSASLRNFEALPEEARRHIGSFSNIHRLQCKLFNQFASGAQKND